VAAKDYYSVLGISRGEAPEGVRAAFRSLAKRYHPDRAGAESAERFREIHEAYAVLSDPRQRGAYDTRPTSQQRPIPFGRTRTRSWPEPLIPRPFEGPRGAPAPRAEPFRQRSVLSAEVLMTPAEADAGATMTLTVPCGRRCSACAGARGFGPLSCELCSSSGVVPGELTVAVDLPPMTSAHATYDVMVDEHIGLVLHLDVRVAES